MSDTFQVTMLSVLREPFADWLRSRGLTMVHVPETAPNLFAVVPYPGGPVDRAIDGFWLDRGEVL